MSRRVIQRAPDLAIALRMTKTETAGAACQAERLRGLLWYFKESDSWSAQPQSMNIYYPATYAAPYEYRESPPALNPILVVARVWGGSGGVRWMARWNGSITFDEINNPGTPQDFTNGPPRVHIIGDSVVVGLNWCAFIDMDLGTTNFACRMRAGILELSALDDAGATWGPLSLVMTEDEYY